MQHVEHQGKGLQGQLQPRESEHGNEYISYSFAIRRFIPRHSVKWRQLQRLRDISEELLKN